MFRSKLWKSKSVSCAGGFVFLWYASGRHIKARSDDLQITRLLHARFNFWEVMTDAAVTAGRFLSPDLEYRPLLNAVGGWRPAFK